MKLISDYYLNQNKEMHKDESWAVSGQNWANLIKKYIRGFCPESILDYGCGKGLIGKSLRKNNLKINEYDPAIEDKDVLPVPADFVICTDVLEHIEPEYLNVVLSHLQQLINVVGFFNIVTQPAKHQVLPDGTNPHKIIKSRKWWVEKLSEYWKVTVINGRGKDHEITCLVSPKYDMTVACCYWGGWCGEWGTEYINRLYYSVKRNTTKNVRFVCFTDQNIKVDNEIDILPFETPSYMDILPKMAVYKPLNGLYGHIFVMDLDTVIVNNLDDIFGYRGEFCCKANIRSPHEPGGDMLSFKNGFGNKTIWEPLCNNIKEIEQKTNGDERAIYKMLLDWKTLDTWQMLYPGQYLSYKLNIKKNDFDAPLSNTRLISFHGIPRPHECLDIPWVKENWR